MNPIRWCSGALLSLLLLTPACSTLGTGSGSSHESSQGISSEKIDITSKIVAHRYRFPNGLRLVVIPDTTSPTIAYQTWFGVGSREEVKGYTGLAHLFEHMMFKETKNLKDGEFDKILEEAGAEGENAFTTQDNTTYVQELPKERLELIAKLEADRMQNLIVDEKSFSTEREVVQNERRYRNENSPDGLMFQELYDTAFTIHPYHWPVIGYEQDLARMTAKDAMDFYKKFYSPNHAVVVVTGDVKPAQVRDTVEKYYGQIPGQTGQRAVNAPEPEQKRPRRKVLALNIQVEKFLMSYPIPALNHDDLPALTVLQAILTNGKSSRLHRALVETGVASSVWCEAGQSLDPGLFICGSTLQKGKHSSQAESLITSELGRLSRERVSATEMERVKNAIEYGFYASLDSNTELASFAGNYELLWGDLRKGILFNDRLKAVTPDDVLEVARKYFDPNRRTVITGIKKEAAANPNPNPKTNSGESS